MAMFKSYVTVPEGPPLSAPTSGSGEPRNKSTLGICCGPPRVFALEISQKFSYSYGHLSSKYVVINGIIMIIHSMNRLLLVLIIDF